MGFGEDDHIRPLCSYPLYAEYNGAGDLKNVENWTCEETDPEKY